MSGAGEGNLEISIAAGGGAAGATGSQNIENRVRQLAAGRFEVNYTPREGGPHAAHVTFNGQHVTGTS